MIPLEYPCGECDGTGEKAGKPCEWCEGQGVLIDKTGGHVCKDEGCKC